MPTLRSVLLAALLGCAGGLKAGHFAGGNITYECLGGTTYEVTLDLFLDCAGAQMIPQDLNFQSDCGVTFSLNGLPAPAPTEVSQLCAAELPNSTCNGGALPGIEHYQFTVVVNLAACNDWTISWDLCCRAGTNNLVGVPGMYVSANLDNATAPCNNSPVFTDYSIPYVCVGQPASYNYGITEPDGDSITYALISALQNVGVPVPYQGGFTGALPIPGVALDTQTGQLTFTPPNIGNYVVAVLVNEYDANGVLIGQVMRDQMFIAIACTGNTPTTNGISGVTGAAGTYLVTGSNSIEICDGANVCVDVTFTDVDPATTLQVVSQAATLLPGSTFTITGTNPAVATMCWTADINNSPVNVLIQADDGACPIENTVSTSINFVVTQPQAGAFDPGTNGAITVCENGAPFPLFAELGGTPDAGGTWTAPGGASHSGTYDPTVDAPGVYTYTVGNACGAASATVTVTENPLPNAGTNGNLQVCDSGAPVALFSGLGGAPLVGGTWTGPGGVAHGPNYDPAIDVPGIYTYTVNGIAPCITASATVTVTEVAPPNAGTNGFWTLCGQTGTVNMFLALGGAPQAGGTWTTPGGVAHGAVYDPVIDNPGVYTYTVPGTAPCSASSATVTVTENPAANAGTNGTITICSTSAPFVLFAQLGGTPDAGGAWTGPGGAAHGPNYNPAVDGSGVYTYTVAGIAPCLNSIATVTVTENAAPNVGTSNAITVCSNGAPVSLLGSLLGGPSPGGTWTDPGGLAHGAMYDPLVDAPGIYTYTILGNAPCANASTTITVTETAAPNAGANGALTVCANGVATGLFASLGGAPQAGGTWTAPGGAAHSGTYDPAIDGPGAYTYTVAGTPPCANATATVTVTENAPPNAGTNGALTICANGAATGLFASLGGAPQAGGTWTAPGGGAHSGTYDPAVDGQGVYVYTVAGTAPCANAVATVTVTENAAPNAGTNGVLTLCSNGGATGLFASLGGAPQAGGTWTAPGGAAHSGTYDPAVDGPGAYTYTVAGAPPCANATATVTVTENAPPNAGTNGALTICANGAATGLFASLGGAPQAGGTWTAPGGGAHSGTYDPALDPPGVYTYIVVGTAPCTNATATVTVTQNAAPNAGTNGVLTLCANGTSTGLFALLGGVPQAGGTWTAPGGAAHSGTYDPAVDGPGAYTYSVAGAPPCANATATVTVTENAPPNAGTNGALTICANGAATGLFASLGGAPQAGGTWTAPGGGAHSGTYDPALDAPGVYTYTVVGTAPCTNATATVTVTENASPNAGTNGVLTLCANGTSTGLFALLGGVPQAGGTWTAPGGAAHSGTYDPAVDGPGAYTYTVAGAPPCANATATVTVTENAPPNAGTNGALTICANGAATGLFASLGGAPQAGGAWTAPGGGAHSGAYDPAVDGPGVYTYTVAGAVPCADAIATVTVTENAAPDAGTNGALTVCGNGVSVGLFASLGGAPQGGGTWTAPGGAAHSGTYDPLLDAPGVYTYSVIGAPLCGVATATVLVTENAPAIAGVSAGLAVCSDGLPTALFLWLAGAPQAGGSWTDPGGSVHSGSYDSAVDGPGAYTYTVSGVAPCVDASATVTVTENAAPDAGADAILDICSDGPPASLFALLGATAQPGGSWMSPGGVAHSGIYDPAVDVPGVYSYTVVGLAPCANAAATVTVTEVAAADAGTNGAMSVCTNGAVVPLIGSLGGTPDAGGVWTAPGGVPHSGVFDPSVDVAGNYTYSVAGVFPCASVSAVVAVSITTAPDAGSSGAAWACGAGPVVDLFTSLVGAPDAGGTWTAPGGAAHSGIYDPLADAPGNYTYTVVGTAPCPNATATITVMEVAPANAGADASLITCATGAATPLFPLLSGAQPGGTWTAPGGAAHLGLFDPAVDAPGAYTYTVAGTTPCPDDAAVVTVAITGSPDAGADGAVTICEDGALTALFSALGGGPDAGGTWTDPNGNAHSGTVDPANDPAGIYTYTIAAVPPCSGDVSTVTVTINVSPDPGTNGALTVCDQGAPQSLFAALGGSPDAGGVWTDPNGNAHSGSIDPSVDPAGNYTYTVNGIAPCGSASSVVAVTIIGSPTAGSDGAWTLCEDMAPTSLFAALGGGPDAGGTWTDPNGNAHSGTVDPANDPAGIYTYTIAAVPPCLGDVSTVTVTINVSPDPGTNGALTVCDQGAPQSLFAALGGNPDAGGTWTDPNGNAHSGSIDPSVDPAGNYTYTVNGIAPCGSASSTVAVTITGSPTAGTDGAWTLCEDMAPTSLFAALGGGPDAGGTWTDPNGNAHSGTVDPSTDPAGIYTYTIAAVPPCLGDVSTVTVTINTLPDPGINGALTVCDQGAPQSLFGALGGSPDVGGVWTDPNGNAHSGSIDPSVDPAGNYTYTVNGIAPCGSASSTVAVTITGSPTAGTDGAWTLCEDMAPTSLFAALGGGPDAGGTWTDPNGNAHSGTVDPANDPAGIYTYTIAAVPPCLGDVSTVTVTINVSPDPGTNGSLTVCDQGAPQSLFAALGGNPDAGGTWTDPNGNAHSGSIDPSVDPAGNYTYTVNGIAPCGSASSTVAVTITGSPTAGTDGAWTLCEDMAPTSLFAALGGGPDAGGTWTDPNGNAHSGTVDPSTDPAGIYTYTIAAVPPCLGDVSTVTVTINVSPDPGTNGSLTVCDQGAPQSLFGALGGSPDVGGVWTDPNGNAHSGSIDPSVDPAGNYTYTVNGIAPCGSASSVVAVTITGSPTAGSDGAWTLCEDMAPTSLFAALGGGPDAGGTWTDPNGNAHSGTVDPSTDPAGIYTYTIPAVPPCLGDVSTVTVTINALPDPGINGALTVCDQGAPQSLFAALGGSPDAGGAWTDPNGNAHSGSIDPSVDPAGNYTYTVNGIAPCGSAFSVVAVTITGSPNAGTDGAWTLCESFAPTSLFAALGGGPDAGGAWTDPNGNAHSGTVDPATDPSGIYTYTIAGLPPCPSDVSTVTVTINPSPDAGLDGALTVCDQGAAQSLFAALGGSPDAGGTWTDPNGNAHSGSIDPSVDPAGNYTYTVNGIAPCGSATSTVAVTITGSPNAGTVATITLCENAPIVDLFLSLGGTPDAGGVWTDPNGNTHSGLFDPASDPAGSYTYTIAAVPPCLGATAGVNVILEAVPDAGLDASDAFCVSWGAVNLFNLLGGSPTSGGTWTDPNGDPFVGLFNTGASVVGTYTYTVTGIVCPGDQSAVTINVVPDPDAGTSNTISVCATASGFTMLDSLLGTPDNTGTWFDINSLAVPPTFDPAFDPAGVYTYVVPAPATCPGAPPTSTLTVVVDPLPDAGLDAGITVCTGDAPFALVSQLGGNPDAGGSWTDPNGIAFGPTFDPGTDAPGNYTYTVGGGACPPDQSVVAIAVNPGPDAGLDNAIALCSNGAPIQLTGALLGTPDLNGSWTDPNGVAFGGTFDPGVSQTGAYTYTVPGNAGCPDDLAELTMAVSPEADAGTDGAAQLCSNDAPVDLFTLLGGTPAAGGAWTDPNGIATTAVIDPSTAPSGAYTYTVTGLPPCVDATASVSVTITPAPDAGADASAIYCNTSPPVQLFGLLGGAPQSGGAWTDPNGNPSGGAFDPASDTPGAYTYRVVGQGNCIDDEAVVTVNVSIAADAGSDGSITVCSNEAAFALFPLLGGSPDAGGTWTDPNGTAMNGTVDPFAAAGGDYTYTVNSPVPCVAQSAVVNVTIIPNNAPEITIDIGNGCAPVMASITSSYTGPGTCVWDLGNGTIINECEPDSIEYLAGTYDVSVTIDPGNGCSGTFSYTDAIVVVDQPTASFYALPDTQVSIANTEVFFANTSAGANAWLWEFDSLDESTAENPLYVFPNEEPGQYDVCLVAYASATCTDTACHTIIVVGSGVWVPNSFTPDGDGHNDFFFPVLGNPSPEEYRFAIFDRWGQPLFDTNDPGQGWDGNFADGQQTPLGVYVWKLWMREPFTSDRLERTGHVTLVR